MQPDKDYKQDIPRICLFHQAGGQIDGIADNCVFTPAIAANGPGKDAPCCHADFYLQSMCLRQLLPAERASYGS